MNIFQFWLTVFLFEIQLLLKPRLTNIILWYFQKATFVDAVIRPIHKETTDRFFVEEILTEMSPKSFLPSDRSRTFQSFYQIKYKKNILQVNQPLLRIGNANRHHFMFAPISKNGPEDQVISIVIKNYFSHNSIPNVVVLYDELKRELISMK